MAVRVPTGFKNEGDKGGKGDRGAAGRDPAAQNGGETKPAGGAAAPGGKGRAEARAAAKLARAEESQGVANILKEEGLLDAEVMQQLDVLVSAPRAACAAALSRRAVRQDTLTGAPVAEDTLMFAVPVTHNAAELRAVSQPFFPPFRRAFWLPGATICEKNDAKNHEKWPAKKQRRSGTRVPCYEAAFRRCARPGRRCNRSSTKSSWSLAKRRKEKQSNSSRTS